MQNINNLKNIENLKNNRNQNDINMDIKNIFKKKKIIFIEVPCKKSLQ